MEPVTASPGQPPTQERLATQGAMPPPPPVAPAARRHRVLKAVVLVVGTLIVMAVAGAVLQPSDGTFLAEDFDSGTTQFSTDSDRLVDLTVEDGAYHIAIKDPTAPQIARFVFSSARHAFRFEADVSVEGEGGWGAGVGCWAGDSAYVFTMLDTGEVVLIETLSDATGERQFVTEPTTVDTIGRSTEPIRLRIDCIGGGTDPTIVSGWVNGQPIVSIADPDGYDSFMAVGIFAFAGEAGTEFRVDNVVGAEDRPEPAVSPVVLPISEEPIVQRSTPVTVSAACDAVFADARESSDARPLRPRGGHHRHGRSSGVRHDGRGSGGVGRVLRTGWGR